MSVYFFYILSWLRWSFDWTHRLPAFLADYLELNFKQYKILKVNIKILGELSESQLSNIKDTLIDISVILDQCNIELEILGYIQTIKYDNNVLNSITCGFSGIFSKFFIWFSKNSYHQRDVITIFFIPNFKNFRGCAYPGTNWIIVDINKAKGRTIVHEIGHLCDLWSHSKYAENIMSTPSNGRKISNFQSSMIRTSRFVTKK